MGGKFCAILLASLIVALPLAHGAELEGGKDVNPEGDVPFTVSAIDTPSVDKKEWTLTIEMSQEAADNGTTFEILTQICLNTGVCDPPVPMDAEIDDRLHTISVTPPNGHTYVNWRVKAIDSDGNKTNYPSGDWYKIWSSCWYNEGEWGGIDSVADGCKETSEDTPGFGIIASLVSISIAALAFSMRTRKNSR